MDDRQWQPSATEIPIRQDESSDRPTADAPAGKPAEAGSDSPGTHNPLADPHALTILTTEHWSLLSARGLVYNEAFARAGMFLTFLSGTFVALGLVSTASGFSRQFLVVAAIALALDLFIGLATMGRLVTSSREDMRYLQGMNRLRHAYHEMVPGLEGYFVMRHYDDIRSVFAIYEVGPRPSSLQGILHGLTTTIGMVSAINAALAGILAGVLAQLVVSSAEISILVAVVAFVVGAALGPAYMTRAIRAYQSAMVARFPAPPDDEDAGRRS